MVEFASLLGGIILFVLATLLVMATLGSIMIVGDKATSKGGDGGGRSSNVE